MLNIHQGMEEVRMEEGLTFNAHDMRIKKMSYLL
jgi:hypothetical protein